MRAAAGPVSDWVAFGGLAKRHGVVALAGNALWKADIELPDDQARHLRQSVDTHVRHSMQMTRETARWARTFADAGIACRFFKGPTLATLAYHDFGLKRSADIDVLIPLAQAPMARDLLERAGFAPVGHGDWGPDYFTRYLRWAKEVAFADKDGTVIELHVRLSQNRQLSTALADDGKCQDIAIGSVTIPTFNDELLYSYLCYHGAAHGWSRVKWLADLNAFLETRDVELLHKHAVKRGLSNASLVALSLCSELLGRKPGTYKQLSRVARIQHCVAVAAIGNAVGGDDINAFSRVGLAITASNFMIGGNFRSATGAVAAVWIQPYVRARFADRSAWVFHALRLPRFILKLSGKFGAAFLRQNRNRPNG